MALEIPVTEARAAFAELINRVGYGGERVVITRHGKPLVALIPATELASEVLDLGSRHHDTAPGPSADTRTDYGLAARHDQP